MITFGPLGCRPTSTICSLRSPWIRRCGRALRFGFLRKVAHSAFRATVWRQWARSGKTIALIATLLLRMAGCCVRVHADQRGPRAGPTAARVYWAQVPSCFVASSLFAGGR